MRTLAPLPSTTLSHVAHNLRKTCIKRRFEGIHDRFQKDFLNFVTRNSKLFGLKQNASRWTRWRRKISPIIYRPKSMRYKKTWSISPNTSGRNAPMKLRSDFSEALTKMHRLHHESGEERLAPIPFWQYQKYHSSSSSSSTSWWQWNDHLWSS